MDHCSLILAQSKAFVDQALKHNVTPLTMAAQEGHQETVELLLPVLLLSL